MYSCLKYWLEGGSSLKMVTFPQCNMLYWHCYSFNLRGQKAAIKVKMESMFIMFTPEHKSILCFVSKSTFSNFNLTVNWRVKGAGAEGCCTEQAGETQ